MYCGIYKWYPNILKKTLQKHGKYLRIVLQIPRENKLFIKPKSKFCLKEVKFLGDVMS